MTIQDAIAIGRATRQQLHADGHANADDAYQRAAEVLAGITCETCRHLDDELPFRICRVWQDDIPAAVPGCLAWERRDD